jgi:hypothetical protein
MSLFSTFCPTLGNFRLCKEWDWWIFQDIVTGYTETGYLKNVKKKKSRHFETLLSLEFIWEHLGVQNGIDF